MKLKSGKIELRFQRLSDAKRFYEILRNPNFKYFPAKPKSVKEEEKFLKGSAKRRRKKFGFDFAILYNGILIGAIGVKIDQHRKFIGEIGYFIDENYWGKGITTKAVKLLEKYAFQKLKLKRIEIIMNPKHKASEKVAIKAGYKKEGIMRKVNELNGKLYDGCLYAKVKP